jgi:hypothetical protein
MALTHPNYARVHTCIFYTLKILHLFSNYSIDDSANLLEEVLDCEELVEVTHRE